ncbi:MAG: hypothetical protein ACO28M_03605 [Vulcanococcus sp.]
MPGQVGEIGVGQPWRTWPVFAEKSPDFLDAVASYLEQLDRLSPQQRQDLALFKAAELVNALIQMRERKQAADRVGPAMAQASFALVRAAIRDRQIALAGGERTDLREPVLRDLIDEGCRLFHAGKKDPDLYQRALALSAAQCIALHEQLKVALERYASDSGLELPESLREAVQQAFIEPYRRP